VRRINADLTLEADSRVLEHIRWEAGLTPHSRLMDEHIANLPPELRGIVYGEKLPKALHRRPSHLRIFNAESPDDDPKRSR
jgi:hypothetical protein